LLPGSTSWPYSRGITASWYVSAILGVRIHHPTHSVPGLARMAINAYIQTRTAKGFLLLSVFFFLLIIPINLLAAKEGDQVSDRAAGSVRR
jgi:hypothetical protein